MPTPASFLPYEHEQAGKTEGFPSARHEPHVCCRNSRTSLLVEPRWRERGDDVRPGRLPGREFRGGGRAHRLTTLRHDPGRGMGAGRCQECFLPMRPQIVLRG